MTADPGREAMAAAYARSVDRDRAAVETAHADRDARRAAILARYGSPARALDPCPRERDLDRALWRLIAPGTPEAGGPHLMGWRGPQDGPLPMAARREAAAAIPGPATAEAAWEEHHHWRHRAEAHDLLGGPGLPLCVRARRSFLEDRLDALFAMLPYAGPGALEAWSRLERGEAGGPPAAEQQEQPAPPASPVEPGPAPIAVPTEPNPPLAASIAPAASDGSPDPGDRPGDGVSARSGENPPAEQVSRSPDPGTGTETVDPAEPDQPKRTRAEKQAAVRALLGEPLTDREIARRVGVSPTTVAALRRGAA